LKKEHRRQGLELSTKSCCNVKATAFCIMNTTGYAPASKSLLKPLEVSLLVAWIPEIYNDELTIEH
jgi:hypothetical protein